MNKYRRARVVRVILTQSIDHCFIQIGEFATKRVQFCGAFISFDGMDVTVGYFYDFNNSDFDQLINSVKGIKNNGYKGKVLFPLTELIRLKIAFKGIKKPGVVKVKSYLSPVLPLYYSGWIFAGEISINKIDDLIIALESARNSNYSDRINSDRINIDMKHPPANEWQLNPRLGIPIFIFIMFLILYFILYGLFLL